MGIFDKAKEALSEHADQANPLIDRAADAVDQRTGGTHGEQIDRGAELAKDRLGDYAGRDDAVAPAEPGQPA